MRICINGFSLVSVKNYIYDQQLMLKIPFKKDFNKNDLMNNNFNEKNFNEKDFSKDGFVMKGMINYKDFSRKTSTHMSIALFTAKYDRENIKDVCLDGRDRLLDKYTLLVKKYIGSWENLIRLLLKVNLLCNTSLLIENEKEERHAYLFVSSLDENIYFDLFVLTKDDEREIVLPLDRKELASIYIKKFNERSINNLILNLL